MAYTVKEIFLTIQGEGANAGRPAVFCRFAGCNLWSGREADRARAVCAFCDTDFAGVNGPGGGRFETAEDLATAVARRWGGAGESGVRPFVVCTGGEPLLQLDAAAVAALHARGFEVGIETNGTCRSPAGIDWICVSPKAGAELVLRAGNELKLVFPQAGLAPREFERLGELETPDGLRFLHYFLQPMDGPERDQNTRLAIEYCLAHPRWRLSLQTHKLLGIP